MKKVGLIFFISIFFCQTVAAFEVSHRVYVLNPDDVQIHIVDKRLSFEDEIRLVINNDIVFKASSANHSLLHYIKDMLDTKKRLALQHEKSSIVLDINNVTDVISLEKAIDGVLRIEEYQAKLNFILSEIDSL